MYSFFVFCIFFTNDTTYYTMLIHTSIPRGRYSTVCISFTLHKFQQQTSLFDSHSSICTYNCTTFLPKGKKKKKKEQKCRIANYIDIPVLEQTTKTSVKFQLPPIILVWHSLGYSLHHSRPHRYNPQSQNMSSSICLFPEPSFQIL